MLSRDLSLPNLRNLKFSRLAISEASLNAFLPLCPALRRLDVSFTVVRHPLLGAYPVPPLEKLSLTSTGTSNPDLLALLPRLPNLATLSLGALGASQRSIAAIDASMTLTDPALLKVLPALQTFDALDSLSLVGNIKLGPALAPFIATVGRACKVRVPSPPSLNVLTPSGAVAQPLRPPRPALRASRGPRSSRRRGPRTPRDAPPQQHRHRRRRRAVPRRVLCARMARGRRDEDDERGAVYSA